MGGILLLDKLIEILKVVVANAPIASYPRTVTLNSPATVGIPEITPLVLFSPEGRLNTSVRIELPSGSRNIFVGNVYVNDTPAFPA